MRPSRFPSLGLRDPAFLGGAPLTSWGILGDAPPAALATDTVAWYKASAYQSINPLVCIGNLVLPAADRLNPALSNLVPQQLTGYMPSNVFEDYGVNHFFNSENVSAGTPWTFQNCTPSGATNLDFAGSGYIRHYRTTTPLESFTISVKLKINSGTPTINFRVAGSASGTTVPLGGVPSGAWQTFSNTFISPNSGSVEIGLQITGACNIDATEFQVRGTNDWPYYVATTGQPIERAYGRVKTWGTAPTQNVYITQSYSFFSPGADWRGAAGLPKVGTMYCAVRLRSWTAGSNGYLWRDVGGSGSLSVVITSGHQFRTYVGAFINGPVVDKQEWLVLTAQFNAGANASLLRRNKDVGVPITANAISCQQMNCTENSGTNYNRFNMHEYIFRDVLDDASTQDAIVEYMASWLGLVV